MSTPRLTEVFVLREAKCPYCGSKGAYVGFNSVECDNPKCGHFKQSKAAASPEGKKRLQNLITWLETGKAVGDYDDMDGPGDWKQDFYSPFNPSTPSEVVHIVDNSGRVNANLPKLKQALAKGFVLNSSNEWLFHPQHWADEEDASDKDRLTMGLDRGIGPISPEANKIFDAEYS